VLPRLSQGAPAVWSAGVRRCRAPRFYAPLVTDATVRISVGVACHAQTASTGVLGVDAEPAPVNIPTVVAPSRSPFFRAGDFRREPSRNHPGEKTGRPVAVLSNPRRPERSGAI
jgi:hypothetical protein